jgi:hydroxyacylglutathione hydrolase
MPGWHDHGTARKKTAMILQQYYLDCLSHASYLIGDETTGRAVVVDPQRDVAEYVADAKEYGLRIELVIETHFHADFLSGHLELAKATGAKIVYSSVAETEFESMGVADGERYSLGDVTLEFRHTPGHTPESLSIVVYEHAGDEVPYGVMTGDTLFIGDVGRPDLLASIGFTRDELADKLYDSLHKKLMTLPDATRVYPAHGAGSACGKNLSTDLWSTMGDQKATNYALRAPDKATFMNLVTEGQPPAPSYFVYDAILNRKDRGLLDETKMPEAMTYEQVRDAIDAGAVLVDGRTPEEFAQGHLRHAINIGLEGRYAEFAGSVLPSDVDIVLFTEPGQELEGKNRLARIGFDRVIGYLADPYQVMFSHQDDVQVASRLTAKAFDERAASMSDLQIVDVRNPGEVAAGTIPNAIAIPVGQLPARLGELDPALPTVVYCAGGYRSSVAASLLRQHGFTDVSDILGGFGAWEEAIQNA